MQIKLDKDTITPELKRLVREVGQKRGTQPIFQAGAKAVQVGISKHLKRLQARGNKRGWPSAHFFAGGPTSVERKVGIAKVTNTGAEVTIADPRFVHRIEGGTVTAKRARMLAIPLTAEAYALSGKGTIRESMPGLKVWKTRKGLYLIKEEIEKRGRGAGSGERGAGRRSAMSIGRVRVLPMFKLVRSVTHGKHPDEMPKTEELSQEARGAMEGVARRLLGASAGQ
jgi:hypothetical protein